MPWPPQPSEYLELVERVAALEEEGGGGSGEAELDYVEIDEIVTVSATTPATANVCIEGSEITLDGSTRICIEAYSPAIETSSTSLASVTVVLYDGDEQVAMLAWVGRGDGSRTKIVPLSVRKYLTPSAGDHTYSVRAYRGQADGSFYADEEGDDTFAKAYMRITTAAEVE